MSRVDVFSALSDPTRRELLDLLAAGPRSAGELVSQISDLTQPGVSRHLRVLRDAQLVNVKVDAQRRIYALRPEGLRELREWIDKYESFWPNRLDALEEHLDKKATPRRIKG